MLKKYLSKLSPNQLYLFTFGAFALFMLDCVIIDPIPFVDEAALLYTVLQGLSVIAQQRGLNKKPLPEGEQEVILEG